MNLPMVVSIEAGSPHRPRLAVVVLNWNGLEDTRDCLRSLRRCNYPFTELVLVDNGSADESVAVLGSEFPEVTLIATGENLGWAGGNNVGIRHALEQGADLVLLLNNDTVVDENCLDELVAGACRTPPGLLHPSIYFFDEPQVAQLDPLEGVVGAARDCICTIDYAYGAALLLHRDVFAKVGLLDERFFLQLEETDYFRRAKAAGFESRVYSVPRVLHKESRSFGGKRTPLKTYYAVRNSMLLATKHVRTRAELLTEVKRFYWMLCGVAAEDAGRGIQGSGLVRWLCSRSLHSRAVRAGIADFIARRFGRAAARRESALSMRV